MPDEPRQTVADLERDLHQRQRDQYRRLQRAAAECVYERRTGKPAASVAEIEAAFPSGSIGTIDPSRHLSAAEIARVLTTATGAWTHVYAWLTG